MSKIDPLHDNSETRLSRALRTLAGASPTQAPAEVGETLARAFHQRHAGRRIVRRVALLAAIVALGAPALLLVKKASVQTPPNTVTYSAHPGQAPAVVSSTPLPVTAQASKKTVVRNVAAHNAASHSNHTTASQVDDFLPLRRLDPTVQATDMQIVRLEVTGRALRQVGAPVSAEMEDRRILADFVVGFDGTPYAVRLVQRHTY